jgi:hypothetical protein
LAPAAVVPCHDDQQPSAHFPVEHPVSRFPRLRPIDLADGRRAVVARLIALLRRGANRGVPDSTIYRTVSGWLRQAGCGISRGNIAR